MAPNNTIKIEKLTPIVTKVSSDTKSGLAIPKTTDKVTSDSIRKIENIRFNSKKLSPEDILSKKVNDFNKKWYNSKRQNIGLNAFYNKSVDEYNDRNSWKEDFVPIPKAPKGNIEQTGKFVKAPGSSDLVTHNIWYTKPLLEEAEGNLSDFNENVTNTQVEFEPMTGKIGYYQRIHGPVVKVESSLNDDDKYSTALHESAHRLSSYDQTKEGSNKTQFNYDYFVDAPEDDHPYLGDKSEQYSRYHEAKRALNLDPNKVYSKQELQSLINSYQPTTFHEDASVRENLLDRYSIDDLTTMFNNSFKTGGRLLQDGGRTIKIYSDDSTPVIKRDTPSLPVASASTVTGSAKPIKKPKLDKPTLKEAITSSQGWTKKDIKGRPNLLHKTSYNETVSNENDARIKRFENSYRKLDPLPILESPKLKPTTVTTTSDPGLIKPISEERKFLQIYDDAKQKGQIEDEGDRFAMKHFGVRPAGFNIDSQTSSSMSDFVNNRPLLKKSLGSSWNSSDVETTLKTISDPSHENYKQYQRLSRKFDLSDYAIPMPSKEGRVAVGTQIDEARRGIDFVNQKRLQNGLEPISDSVTYLDMDLLNSGRSSVGGIYMGLSPKEEVKYGRGYLTTTRGTASHEAGHANPKYNTNMIHTGDVYSDEELKQIFKDSPAYGNIYSDVPKTESELLRYKWWRFPNKHDRELSEGYSDVVETQSNMNSLGYKDYSEESVRDYLDTDLGKGDRFVKLRGGRRGKWFDKLVDALNTF